MDMRKILDWINSHGRYQGAEYVEINVAEFKAFLNDCNNLPEVANKCIGSDFNKEKIVEILALNFHSAIDAHKREKVAQEILNSMSAESAHVPKDECISVEDRLPETKGFILAYDKDLGARRMMDKEKRLVKNLGEQIGYGNMMHLASKCWQEMLIEKYGSPVGAFKVGECIKSDKILTDIDVKCELCEGEGWIWEDNGHGGGSVHKRDCPYCNAIDEKEITKRKIEEYLKEEDIDDATCVNVGKILDWLNKEE